LKCGKVNCGLCTQVRLPPQVFEKLRHLPLPTLGDDDHYIPFFEVFGNDTTEDHQPSFRKPPPKKVKRRLPYYASIQHVKNSQLMVQCTELNMWRIIFSKYKLTKEQQFYLQTVLEDYTYSCGASLEELHLPEEYNTVEIRDHSCFDLVERLYYSAKKERICIYCSQEQQYSSQDTYLLCSTCEVQGKVAVKKK
jgi:hypothetical protein